MYALTTYQVLTILQFLHPPPLSQLQYTGLEGAYESNVIASEDNREFILQYLKDEDIGSLKLALPATRGERIAQGEAAARALRAKDRESRLRGRVGVEGEREGHNEGGEGEKGEDSDGVEHTLAEARRDIEALRAQILERRGTIGWVLSQSLLSAHAVPLLH